MRLFALALSLTFGLGAARAQTTKITLPETPLLPQSFGEWKATAPPAVPLAEPAASLVNASKSALEEDGPQRSQVGDYARNGKTVHIEAVEFGDKSGAYSAFTLLEQPGMRDAKDLGDLDSVADNAVLFTVGSSLVLVNGANATDIASLKPLVDGLPKPEGTKGVPPMLPTLLPAKGIVQGSIRYALGAASYQAEGGVLPSQSLGWDKSAEAVTAKYSDKRGQETLTVLLYPTPTLAGISTRLVEGEVPGMGSSFANARVRREGELVMLANGTFSTDEAQKMLENIHLSQVVSFDKDVQPVFQVEIAKTFTLLQKIMLLSALLCGSALFVGLFLGFGRAAIRVLQGKPAAVESEFLSLHLAPQNAPPQFGPGDGADGLSG